MSILFTSSDGWIISHLDYVNEIYKNIEIDETPKILRFNENFFKINSQYLRQNQVKKKETTIVSKKKKRKLHNVLPDNILQQNIFIKDKSEKILNEAKNKEIFNNFINVDNNEISRLESNNFYQSRLESNSINYYGSNKKNVAIVAEFQKEKYVFPKNCQFYCYDVKNLTIIGDVNNKFDFIILDPPWWNKSVRRKKLISEDNG